MNQILKFGAEWCGPCKALKPILEELKEKYKETVEIVDIDADTEADLCYNYNVRSLPTLVFLQDGKVKEQFHGAKPKSFIEQKIIDTYVQQN